MIDEFRRRSEPSPAYARPPGWGFPAPGTAGFEPGGGSVVGDAAAATPREILGVRLAFGDLAARVLIVLGAVAALVGLGRYVLLVAMRGESVAWWVETGSSWLTRFAYAAAFVASFVVLVAVVRALLAARDVAFDKRGGDPRSTWAMAASGVIPGVNLLYLPVYVREIEPVFGAARGAQSVRSVDPVDPRTWGLLRGTWWLLLANQLVGALYWWQVLRPGVQASANALVLGALSAGLAAVVAWQLRRVVRAARGAAPVRRFTAVSAQREN